MITRDKLMQRRAELLQNVESIQQEIKRLEELQINGTAQLHQLSGAVQLANELLQELEQAPAAETSDVGV